MTVKWNVKYRNVETVSKGLKTRSNIRQSTNPICMFFILGFQNNECENIDGISLCWDFDILKFRHIGHLTFGGLVAWWFSKIEASSHSGFDILRVPKFYYFEILIYRGFNTEALTFWGFWYTVHCTEASKYWGFDIQRLQHFLVLIYRGFTILMFWYTEASTFWGFDIQRLKHFNVLIYRNFNILRSGHIEASTCGDSTIEVLGTNSFQYTVLKIQNIIKFRNIEASAFRGFHVLRIGLIEDSTW